MSANIITFSGNDDAKARSWSDFSSAMSLLFKPGDVIEFRCLAKGLSTEHLWSTLDELADIHDQLCQWNDEGRNVYYGCNPRTGVGGTKATDVAIANTLYVDRDGGCTPEELTTAVASAGLPSLSYLMLSGGGCQGGWPLENPIPVEEWCAIQRGINAAVKGADVTICDAPRIMRAPGFVNRKAKYGPDFPFAHTVHLSNARHDHTVFPVGRKSYTPPTTANGQPVESSIDTTGQLPGFAEAFLSDGTLIPGEGKAQPSRRETAYRVAIECAASGMPQQEAVEKIRPTLERLGLDAEDVEDVVCRQIPNAYAQPRTPTIDPDKLPKTIPSKPPAEPTVEVQHYDAKRVKVIARRGALVSTDVIDPTKASQRKKFVNLALAELGEDTNTTAINEQLKAIATGEATPTVPEGVSIGLDDVEEVDAASIVRPERFVIRCGGEVVSAFTVPVLLAPSGEVGAEWATFTLRDGERSAGRPQNSIEVGGSTFSILPELPGALASDCAKSWSRKSRRRWLADGGHEIPPSELIAELEQAVARFIEFPGGDEPMSLVVALFAIVTHNAPLFSAYPYLLSTAPAGSGKSRTLEVLDEIAFRARLNSSASGATVFRQIHALGVTLLIDEAQDVFRDTSGNGKDVRDIVLSGYKRGKFVPRCVGEDNKVAQFHCGGPKAFASTEMPDRVLGSRCIHTVMLRTERGSPTSDLDPSDAEHEAMWARLRDGIYTWSIESGDLLTRAPNRGMLLPKGLIPRTKEVWGSLAQVAWVLEQQGAQDILGRLTAYVALKELQVSDVRVSPTAAAILRALALLRIEDPKHFPTAGQIANKASDFAEGLTVHPRTVTKILTEYSLPFRKQLLHGRSVNDQPVSRILEVAHRYELRLFDEEKERQLAEAHGLIFYTPTPLPDLATHPTYPTLSSLQPEENEENAKNDLPTHIPPGGDKDSAGVGKPVFAENAVSPVLEKQKGGIGGIGGQISEGGGGIEKSSEPTPEAGTVSGEVEL